jgi:hypothetical protein
VTHVKTNIFIYISSENANGTTRKVHFKETNVKWKPICICAAGSPIQSAHPSSTHRSKTLAHPTATKRPSSQYNLTCTVNSQPSHTPLPSRAAAASRNLFRHGWVPSPPPLVFWPLCAGELCALTLSLPPLCCRGVHLRVGAMEEEAVGCDALRAARAVLGVQAAAGYRPPHQAHPPWQGRGAPPPPPPPRLSSSILAACYMD